MGRRGHVRGHSPAPASVLHAPAAGSGRRGVGGGRGGVIAARRARRLGLDDGGHAGGVRLPAHVLGVGELVVLLVLHAAVLEPDLDLAF